MDVTSGQIPSRQSLSPPSCIRIPAFNVGRALGIFDASRCSDLLDGEDVTLDGDDDAGMQRRALLDEKYTFIA